MRTILLLALLATAGVAGCAAPTEDGASAPATIRMTEGFESATLDPAWQVGSELPADPNRPGESVSANATRTADHARTGSGSLRLALDGRQDDGTIWIQRAIPVQRGVAYDVNLTAWAWSRSESFNTIAHLVTYVGEAPATAEASFGGGGQQIVGSSIAAREPLDQQEGWRAYRLQGSLPATDGDALYVAIGISLVWETETHYDVDDLELVVTPRA